MAVPGTGEQLVAPVGALPPWHPTTIGSAHPGPRGGSTMTATTEDHLQRIDRSGLHHRRGSHGPRPGRRPGGRPRPAGARARDRAGHQRLRGEEDHPGLQPAGPRSRLRPHPGAPRRPARLRGRARPGLLVSSLSSIAIGPGETPQPDPRRRPGDPAPPAPPRRPICNTMWALDRLHRGERRHPARPRLAHRRPLTRPPGATRPCRPRWPGAACWCGTGACGTAAGPTPPTSDGWASP